MNVKKQILLAALITGSTVLFAQEQRIKEEGKVAFKPHWFMQVQAGAAHTIGEAAFSDLISPAAAVNVGYKFAPAFGVRIGGSGWQAKGGWVSPKQDFKYKYLQGNVDFMVDISTLFCRFNPKRIFNGYLFAGIGANHAFDNGEANALDTKAYEMEYLWQDSKNFITGRMGLGCDIRLNNRLALNIEGNANVMSDKFNSKKAGNCDWQINALIGLSIKLGKDYTKTAPVYYEPEVVVEQKRPAPIVEQPKPKEIIAAVEEAMKQDIFFALNSARIQEEQMTKINSLVEYLTKYPNTKVNITGYADKDTGNAKINKKLSQARANNVAEALKAKGIAANRMIIDSKGDTIQPYGTSKENRVSICLTE